MELRPARIPFLVKIGFSALTPSAVVAFGDPGRLVSVEGDLLASAVDFSRCGRRAPTPSHLSIVTARGLSGRR
jgi:hypothetical protein